MNKPQGKGPSLIGILLGGWMMVWIGVSGHDLLWRLIRSRGSRRSRSWIDIWIRRTCRVSPGEVYYMKGPDRSSVSWQQVRKEILDGASGEVELIAGAFNNWLSASFKIGRPDDDAASGVLLLPGLPKLSSLKNRRNFPSIPSNSKSTAAAMNAPMWRLGTSKQGRAIRALCSILFNSIVPRSRYPFWDSSCMNA